jgi:hypothetical protein
VRWEGSAFILRYHCRWGGEAPHTAHDCASIDELIIEDVREAFSGFKATPVAIANPPQVFVASCVCEMSYCVVAETDGVAFIISVLSTYKIAARVRRRWE